MRPSEVLKRNREVVRRMVLQFGMANPRLFGSALHGDDQADSDLDLLVDAPRKVSLLDLAKLQVAIEAELGIKIDLLTPDALPTKFREQVPAEAVPV